MANISIELAKQQKEIENLAVGYGLDFFETVFEMVTYKQMNQIAAYGGFPIRYPHWRFGMEYESLSKGYEYGLSKIYELVINNDPCYAYLLEGNSIVDQKLVMAHVYGHCDFFKNNKWFEHTDRKMMDTMANHSVKIRRLIDQHGVETVENFIDTCLSIENLIDRYEQKTTVSYEKFKNSGEVPSPEKDILRYLIEFAEIPDWKKEVLEIIRAESYYFAPQGMTKVMNEGWASYWHSKMMTNDICNDSEIVQFADVHSGTMAMNPNGFNPYKLGIELFRDLESRWNKGRFGRDWHECKDLKEKANWDLKLNKGREKIFEVRRNYNDVGFIDEFLTEEFCVEHKMFVYKFNKKTNQFEIDTRDFKAIKSKLLFQIANFGQPIISAVDKNYNDQNELLLSHLFEGVELQPDYMRETLTRVYEVWPKPVSIATVLDKEAKVVRYNGETFEVKDFDKA